MSDSMNKLTRLQHLIDLGTRTKAELDTLDAKIQEIVTVGGEPNVIEKISLNGVEQTITDKAVNLEIVHPEYTVVKSDEAGDYAAVYTLTKDGEQVGAAINIPKDLMLKSGSVDADGNIVLVLNDESNTEIVVNASSLIEYVTSGSAEGDMVVVAVSDDHKVTATITDGAITLAKLESGVQEAIGKAHEHANKDELDLIEAGDKAKWDQAVADVTAIKADYLASANIASDDEVTTALDEIFTATEG